MRSRREVFIPILALVALVLTPAAALAASGLPASVAMEPAAAGPGSTVEVTGIDFPPGKLVEVKLESAADDRDLAILIADEKGYFRTFVGLPDDVPAGAWVLRAVSLDGSSADHAFDAATAGVVDASLGLATGAEASLSGGRGNSSTDILVMLILAVLMAALGGGAAYAWREVHGATVQPGMGAGDDPIWSVAGAGDASVQVTASDAPAWGDKRDSEA
jgi:hypothetical protein